MSGKRRLPLVRSSLQPTGQGMPGHRAIAVAALALALWMPLCLLSIWVARTVASHLTALDGARTASAAAVIVGLLVASFLVASVLASALVRSALSASTPTDSVAGGVLAAIVAGSIAAVAGDGVPFRVVAASVLVLGGVGAAGGGIGGWLGRRGAGRGPRRVDPPPPPH